MSNRMRSKLMAGAGSVVMTGALMFGTAGTAQAATVSTPAATSASAVTEAAVAVAPQWWHRRCHREWHRGWWGHRGYWGCRWW